jgi:hypothetical protein
VPRRLALIFYLVGLFCQLINAQADKDSLSYSLKNFSDKSFFNSFEKQLNTFNFNTMLNHRIDWDNFVFGFRENFRSTIINSTSKNIKDEQYFSGIAQYTIEDNFKAGIYLNNEIYSDDRQVGLNKASILTSIVYTKYSPVKKIELTPFGGFSQNEQIGKKDNGIVYGTEASIDNYALGDFELSSLLKFQTEDISPRKNTYRLINFDINSDLEQTLFNTISANYAEQRKDFYFTADAATAAEFNITNNIQSRTESSYLVQDKIRIIPQNSPLTMDLQGRITWRGIDRNTRYISPTNVANTNYDTRIEESRIEFASGTDYNTKDVNIAFRFSYSERDEKHTPEKYSKLNNIVYDERLDLETQKNNTSQLTNISLLGKFNLSSRDKITFSIFHRKLKYDTPSTENYDDRDELLSIARIMYERDFTQFFKAFVNLEGNINKIVYIFGARSSNNNIKRILKFSSGGFFSQGNFSSANSAEVSANYTVFDYEELNPNFRSFSFRQLVLRDSSVYRFNDRIRLFAAGYLKFSEQGDFKWSSFSSNPVRYLSEQYAEPKIYYDYKELSFGLGIRYFSLSTYNYQNGVDKTKISDYTSLGPTSEISYTVGEKIILKIFGYYEFITTENNSKREMANFSIRLSYKF